MLNWRLDQIKWGLAMAWDGAMWDGEDRIP